MNFNFLAVFVAALIPMVFGFIWYHPKVLGTVWMKANNFKEDDLKGGNMAIIFGISFILSLLLAFYMNFITIHQTHIYSALMDMANVEAIENINTEVGADYANMMAKYGHNFRTFKHGALHGFLASIFFMLPILGTNALFERKGWKYIAVNAGYWTVCLMIMGGIVCAWV
ncbi:MAG: DUF1761 domain-containing protein [Chitinophagales bacterium]